LKWLWTATDSTRFGVALADHIIVQHLADFERRGDAVASLHQRGFGLLADDVVAQLHALIADEDGGSGDELPHLMLRLAAEGAIEGALGIAAAQFRHSLSLGSGR
jgi:hypothetical protein